MLFTPTVQPKPKTHVDLKQRTEVVRSSLKTAKNELNLLSSDENHRPIKIITPSGDLPGSTSFEKSKSSIFANAL